MMINYSYFDSDLPLFIIISSNGSLNFDRLSSRFVRSSSSIYLISFSKKGQSSYRFLCPKNKHVINYYNV